MHISADGWAWFVCGRRLLIWQYKQTLDAGKQRHVLSSQCQELTLPPSDLAHRADLVSVYIAEGSQVSISGRLAVGFHPCVFAAVKL